MFHLKDPGTWDFVGFGEGGKGSRRLDRESTLDICSIDSRSTGERVSKVDGALSHSSMASPPTLK